MEFAFPVLSMRLLLTRLLLLGLNNIYRVAVVLVQISRSSAESDPTARNSQGIWLRCLNQTQITCWRYFMFADGTMKVYSLCTGYFNVQAHSFWCDHVGWDLFGLKSGVLVNIL